MPQSSQNRLLEMMPPSDLAQLRPHLHKVTLDYRMPLCEANEPIRDVYFPISRRRLSREHHGRRFCDRGWVPSAMKVWLAFQLF